MLDMYVIIDAYRKVHKNPLQALRNALIPPAVYYYEHTHENGHVSRCKYGLITLSAFERGCTNRAFLSTIWGRFCQPAVQIFCTDPSVHTRLTRARARAITHMSAQIAPLCPSPVNAVQFWTRGLKESYRTEFRPESAQQRSEDIVINFASHYQALMDILYGPDKDGLYTLPAYSRYQKWQTRRRWFLRRLIGKPIAAIRILINATSFDGGLVYLLRKIENHSGVKYTPTEGQIRHPILWSPVIAWKLWRQGAFR